MRDYPVLADRARSWRLPALLVFVEVQHGDYGVRTPEAGDAAASPASGLAVRC
ncbi:MAG TPA: hypothetical protein VH637_24665 [Streptosporangiaceae bacterium]